MEGITNNSGIRDNQSFLLPYWLKIPGYFFLTGGLILGFFRFNMGWEPRFLDLRVFAVYSVYFDTKFLQLIDNNIIEELSGILFIAGLFFIAFTSDKQETADSLKLRTRALYLACYAEAIFLLLSLIFTFGMAYVYMMILNIAMPFALYVLIYRIMLAKRRLSAGRQKLLNSADRL
jgi:hypothetical protein